MALVRLGWPGWYSGVGLLGWNLSVGGLGWNPSVVSSDGIRVLVQLLEEIVVSLR
jgi:hypothetical protein